MSEANSNQGAQTPVQHVLALPGRTACGETFTPLPEGTPVCAACFVATGSVLFGQAQDTLDLINRVALWCNGMQRQWIPGSEPLHFDQGVGAAAQDVLAIIAEGRVHPPLGVERMLRGKGGTAVNNQGDRIENPKPLEYPCDPSSEDPEDPKERELAPWSVQSCGCALRVEGEAVLCKEHLDELNRPSPGAGGKCSCDGARYGTQEHPFVMDPSCRWHRAPVTEECAMCCGSGSVAVGPWGGRPPKKTCPECLGQKRVPTGHRYQDPTVQPE